MRATAGITFEQDATATEEKTYIEIVGTGLGWIDYDQDGLLDLYLVRPTATEWYTPPRPHRSALYRNNGDGTFTEVTEKTGVGGRGRSGPPAPAGSTMTATATWASWTAIISSGRPRPTSAAASIGLATVATATRTIVAARGSCCITATPTAPLRRSARSPA